MNLSKFTFHILAAAVSVAATASAQTDPALNERVASESVRPGEGLRFSKTLRRKPIGKAAPEWLKIDCALHLAPQPNTTVVNGTEAWCSLSYTRLVEYKGVFYPTQVENTVGPFIKVRPDLWVRAWTLKPGILNDASETVRLCYGASVADRLMFKDLSWKFEQQTLVPKGCEQMFPEHTDGLLAGTEWQDIGDTRYTPTQLKL
jgi:hypothetical protein